MKTKLVIANQDHKKFLFSELPATLQAEISTKLLPQDFGNLLQSSKVVSRNIRKYAVSTCSIYFFTRKQNIINQQQNMIKKFIGPILGKKSTATFYFSNYSFFILNKKAAELLERIYNFNVTQENNNNNFLFQTKTIQSLIHKIKEIELEINHCDSMIYRMRSNRKNKIEFPINAYYFFLLISWLVATLCCIYMGVPVAIAKAALSLILVGFMAVFFAYEMIDGYIQDCRKVRQEAIIARHEKEISRQEREISCLVKELDSVFVNLPKESGSLALNDGEKTVRPSF